MRRFEMTDGGSSKFWEVDVRGAVLVVRFGRIGTDGQTKEKKLASPKAAASEAEKLVREKTGKGYVEKSAKEGAAPKNSAALQKSAASRKSAAPRKSAPIAATWERIERFFAKKHPDIDLKLRPPAKPKAIAAAESALGVHFPDDFRESLLIHDGQETLTSVWWMPVANRLGSLDALVECWKYDQRFVSKKDLTERGEVFDKLGKIRQLLFHPKHIPIAGSPHWDYDRLMIDLAPGPKGTQGQVIARSDIDLIFVAPSFADFLTAAARDLEKGKTEVFAD